MHADMVKLGYDGSYGRVAAFARKWHADRHRAEQTAGRGTYVSLGFQLGEAFQFDWSEDWGHAKTVLAARQRRRTGQAASGPFQAVAQSSFPGAGLTAGAGYATLAASREAR